MFVPESGRLLKCPNGLLEQDSFLAFFSTLLPLAKDRCPQLHFPPSQCRRGFAQGGADSVQILA